MADPNAQPAQSTSPNVSVDTLAAAFGQALNAVKPKAKITTANRTRFNPMNPENEPRKLPFKFFQNYSEVDLQDVTSAEFKLLASRRLKPGDFLIDKRRGPLLAVLDVKRGSQIGLHLRYDNSDINRRMELQSKAPTLEAMLLLCITEYEAQVAERKRRRAAGEDLE